MSFPDATYPQPRYHGEVGEPSATIRRADSPPDLVIRRAGTVGTRVHYLGTGATTGGDFGLYRWDMGPEQGGASPHFHRTITESFFVLSGTMRLYDGRRWVEANAGDFLHVPPGGIHGFRNESGAPASMLILFTPGAPREGYFEELAAIAAEGRQLTPEEWTELYRRHDQYMV
ncbi:MAG TPA: cupin domain-containing protein [Pseudonocardiaceae bacterium]